MGRFPLCFTDSARCPLGQRIVLLLSDGIDGDKKQEFDQPGCAGTPAKREWALPTPWALKLNGVTCFDIAPKLSRTAAPNARSWSRDDRRQLFER
ncbi:hypothetical protein Dace_2191 [Desulfuromonas acetoxidans DSM 684]|uniref:Uncharacterized protein n=1 Tax=Desulfuromonas acetoxidans (strain DSM 684 / 11070) TaxID=281689 RepID=Q1K0P9_DESA6|nr:hypothetical protein Dace_2191 [Desulfuromonas acetoxidans DSM 684]